jgi:hypothetical protein
MLHASKELMDIRLSMGCGIEAESMGGKTTCPKTKYIKSAKNARLHCITADLSISME